MKPLRFLLVDDHAMVREGLRACLQAAGYHISGEAMEPHSALALLAQAPTDVVITDIRMGTASGSELIAAMQAQHSHIPCIVLSMFSEPAYVQRMMSLGAKGYVRKDDPVHTLLQAVHNVAILGKHFISPSLHQRSAATPRERPQLSPKEIAVLRLLALEYTSQDIAQQIGMSLRTVESHRLRLRRKLHLESGSSLQRYAQEYATLEPCA